MYSAQNCTTNLLHMFLIVRFICNRFILNTRYYFTGCVSCLLCNVALKRQTTHSSMYIHNSTLNGASCNAVDGLEDTDFFTGSCFHSIPNDTTPWMQIDLGSDYNITYVNFSLREDNYIHGHFGK